MLLLNIITVLFALSFVYRGIKLFKYTHDLDLTRESIIAMTLSITYVLVCLRALLLIEVGDQIIIQAGLLLNYYLYLGCVTLHMFVGHFVILYLRDKSKNKTGT